LEKGCVVYGGGATMLVDESRTDRPLQHTNPSHAEDSRFVLEYDDMTDSGVT
jgi:hypothetical protein